MTEREFWQTVIRHLKGIIAALVKYKLGEQEDD